MTYPWARLWDQCLITPLVTIQHYSARHLNRVWGHALWGAIGGIREGERYWELFRAVGRYGEVQDIIPCCPGSWQRWKDRTPSKHSSLLFWHSYSGYYFSNETTTREGKQSDQALIGSQVFLCCKWLFWPSLLIKKKQYWLLYSFLQVTCEHEPHTGLTEC